MADYLCSWRIRAAMLVGALLAGCAGVGQQPAAPELRETRYGLVRVVM